MKNETLEQLQEVKRQLQEDHAAEMQAVDLLISRARRERGGDSPSGSNSDVTMPIPVSCRTIKEATSIAVSKSTKPFTTEDIVNAVKKLYTRKEVKTPAVSTALSLLKKDGKIKAVSDPIGAKPGTYVKMN